VALQVIEGVAMSWQTISSQNHTWDRNYWNRKWLRNRILHKGTWKFGTVKRGMKILKYYVKLYPCVWVARFLIKGKINLL